MLRHRFKITDNNLNPRENSAARLILLSVFFFVGCVLGAFFGANFSAAETGIYVFLGIPDEGTTFLQTALQFTWFHILAVLLGTSFLGLIFLPVLSFLKGFVFSCASATIILSYPAQGLVMALVLVGIPAAFAVPVFMAVSDNSFSRSGRLLAFMRGDTSGFSRRGSGRILMCIPVLALGLLAEMKLLPYLLSYLG